MASDCDIARPERRGSGVAAAWQRRGSGVAAAISAISAIAAIAAACVRRFTRRGGGRRYACSVRSSPQVLEQLRAHLVEGKGALDLPPELKATAARAAAAAEPEAERKSADAKPAGAAKPAEANEGKKKAINFNDEAAADHEQEKRREAAEKALQARHARRTDRTRPPPAAPRTASERPPAIRRLPRL